MRWIATLIPALVASSATALTVYDDFADWQAAVGSYAVEDFETYPETLFPLEGGQIVLDELILEADAQGDHEWAGMSGLRLASFWPGKPGVLARVFRAGRAVQRRLRARCAAADDRHRV